MEATASAHGTSTTPSVRYRIEVGGEVLARWIPALADMNIRVLEPSGGRPQSIIEGSFASQAALMELLNGLYDQFLPLKSVRCLE